MGWEYSLIDANWNLMDPGGARRVCWPTAREKSVGMLLWYNSGGPHNEVTEQPRDRMHLRDVRRKEFAMLREWGVKGVKVDFWQSDKQDRIQQYLDLLRDAADFQLMVDSHGCTLPRGWSRTYPHLMSMEAVAGRRAVQVQQGLPGEGGVAQHRARLHAQRRRTDGLHAGYVQRRQVSAPDDLRARAGAVGRVRVGPAALRRQRGGVSGAAEVRARRSSRPFPPRGRRRSSWPASRVRLVVVARKGADGWYIAGISGQETPQTVRVDLSVLGPGPHTLSIVTDGSGPRALASETRTVKAGEMLTVDLLPRGGFAARVAH